jgi:hypothetical protein
MIKTRDMPPHLAQAVKRETSGFGVQWASFTDTKGTPRAARWIWVLAVPATAYMLFDTWKTFAKLLAIKSYATAGMIKLLMATGDMVWTLLWLAAAIASLFVPLWAERKFGEVAHVITDTSLISISATRYGSTTVDICPLGSVLAVELHTTTEDSGTLTILAGMRRASDGDIFRKSYIMASVLEPRQVEALINRLASQAGANI